MLVPSWATPLDGSLVVHRRVAVPPGSPVTFAEVTWGAVTSFAGVVKLAGGVE
ncbi:MAG: hypothetical protein J2P23_07220 [Microlunatus sp.]|nr:hypothetical protein [Microlunatus sp.]